jgi:hypothetical protein
MFFIFKSLKNINQGRVFDCGEGAATSLFSNRLSRLEGVKILGSERLISERTILS